MSRLYALRSMLCLFASILTVDLSSGYAAELPPHLDDATVSAIDRGLSWLSEQQHADGSFGSEDDYANNVGVTALCGMAFLSSGSVPEAGKFADEVNRCCDYLLGCSSANGFIVESEVKTHGPMYGHGFATMFLAELYGMREDVELKSKLKRAVDLILATQNKQGGWRYFPVPEDADISVTVCQVMALRAARNKGVAVPKEAIERAVTYIRKCQNPDGGFRYRMLDAAESKFPRSAAALVALYTAGELTPGVKESGLEYMLQTPPTAANMQMEYYHYGQYYAALAGWHAGDETWDRWYPVARNTALQMQTAEGYWANTVIGDEYGTALTLIVLQLPFDRVPIFER